PLRNLDPVALAEFHDDVEKVHAVELELLAEWLLIDELRKVFVGGDVGKDVEDFLANFGGDHGGFLFASVGNGLRAVPRATTERRSARNATEDVALQFHFENFLIITT